MKRITLALPAPYVGLRPFEESEALLFFGRDAHVKDLVGKLAHERFVAVVGPSGNGKSSLVRAGVIPALHRGALPQIGMRWNVYTVKPGDAPLANLAAALASDARWLAGGDPQTGTSYLRSLLASTPAALARAFRERADEFPHEAILLVIDQFEEIFRFRQTDVDEAEAFVKLLLRTAAEPDAPFFVVITMRSDFLGNCVAFHGLPEAINEGIYLTPRLQRDQLESVVASPLQLVGGEIDPALVAQLLNTLGGDDELPVLQHALLRMWDRARSEGRTRIETGDFEAVCRPAEGIDRSEARLGYALDNQASEIFASLSEPDQRVARRVFLALSERREGRDVRRPRRVSELLEDLGEAHRESIDRIVATFGAAGVGFLQCSGRPDDPVVDISHESLIRQWRQFQSWLAEEDEDRSGLLAWQHRAGETTSGERDWLQVNDFRSADTWLKRVEERGDPSVWARRYIPRSLAAFGEIRAYIIESGRKLEEAKARDEEAKANLARIEREQRETEQKRLQAEAALERERLSTQARVMQQVAEVATREKKQAEAFARESQRKTLIARIFAVGALIAFGFAVWFGLRAGSERDRAETMAREALTRQLLAKSESLLSTRPDQSILLGLRARRVTNAPSAEADGWSRFLGARFGFERVLRGHEATVTSAQFSADGKTVVTASRDMTARLWEAATGKELQMLRGHKGGVTSAQFSPDGKTVVTASRDETARLWGCSVCEPAETVAARLKTSVGRDLDDKERLRFGIPNEIAAK